MLRRWISLFLLAAGSAAGIIVGPGCGSDETKDPAAFPDDGGDSGILREDAPRSDGNPDANKDADAEVDTGPPAPPFAADLLPGNTQDHFPSVVMDRANGKLLVVMARFGVGVPVARPHLVRCNQDATGCDAVDIASGVDDVQQVHALIDSANAKLLVVYARGSGVDQSTGVIRCNLDGSSCSATPIFSALQAPTTAKQPSAAIDTVNGKLFVATGLGDPDMGRLNLGLFRCGLDGKNCDFVNVSAAAGRAPTEFSGNSPKLLIDAVNQKLLITTTTQAGAAGLFRCHIDGTACSYVSLSAQQPAAKAATAAALDAAGGKVLVVVATDVGNRGLFRCNLDGTACSYATMPGTGPFSFDDAVVDVARAKLLVVHTAQGNANKLGRLRCNLDGTACSYLDISAGQGAQSGWRPSAVVSGTKLLVVAENYAPGASGLLWSYSVGVLF